jgi:hypothetical protein
MTDNHGLSAENRALVERVCPSWIGSAEPFMSGLNRLLDAAREESAARVKAEVEESCSFWEPRPTTPAGAGELMEPERT